MRVDFKTRLQAREAADFLPMTDNSLPEGPNAVAFLLRSSLVWVCPSLVSLLISVGPAREAGAAEAFRKRRDQELAAGQPKKVVSGHHQEIGGLLVLGEKQGGAINGGSTDPRSRKLNIIAAGNTLDSSSSYSASICLCR
jgi:hypothetical protein